MSSSSMEISADYANAGDQASQKAEFASALAALINGNLGKAPATQVVRVITRLFKADQELNQPHSLLVHQRSKLLFELLRAYADLGRSRDCWSTVKELACLQPYADNTEELIEVVAKSTRTQDRTNIILLISCHPRVSIALNTREKLRKILGENFRVLIVLGQREEKMHPPQMLDDLLVVDANDNYESLPEKITKALQYIYSTFGTGTSCFKVDEDLPINDSEQLRRLLKALSESSLDYAGFAGNNKENFERTWHFGKCEDKALSRRPYGKRYPGAFAYGPFYYLSFKALKAFSSETIRFPDEILGHLYEDKFVGDTLRETGITISALAPKEWIAAVGQHWWTINRRWEGNEHPLMTTNESTNSKFQNKSEEAWA